MVCRLLITPLTGPDATAGCYGVGSPTTLIAAERHARACLGFEIDPVYCDVIVARWERFSGRVATAS